MRRRLHLHGALKSIHSGPIEVFAQTVAEAIERVTRQLPGFAPNAITGRKEIQISGFSTLASLHAPTDVEDIHLFPPMVFGKNGGILKTIIGIALIVVAVATEIAFPGNPFSIQIGLMGAGLVIGGLMQLLAPAPTSSKRSQYLSNNQNTVAIGTPIPILYGKRRCYGQILSLEISSQDTTG